MQWNFFGGTTLEQQEQQLLLPPQVHTGEHETGGITAASAKEKNSVGTTTKDCFLVWRICTNSSSMRFIGKALPLTGSSKELPLSLCFTIIDLSLMIFASSKRLICSNSSCLVILQIVSQIGPNVPKPKQQPMHKL